MKKGFTLIELIAVVGIMGLIIALILPNLVNRINSKQVDISDASKNLIYAAADLYIDDNSNNYPSDQDIMYCIKLKELVDSGYLEKPLKDVNTNKSISLDKKIEIKFNEYNEPVYKLVNENEC